jgi:hypothetical protein
MILEILLSFVYSPVIWLHKCRQWSAHYKSPLSLSVDCPSVTVAFHKTLKPFVIGACPMTVDSPNPIVSLWECLVQFYTKYTIACSSDHIILEGWIHKATRFQTRLPSYWLYMASLHNRITVCLVAVVEVKELIMTIVYIFIWVILVHVVSALYLPCKTQKFLARKPELFGLYQ